MKPLVSIIIPAYNAERYIRRALASAVGQTHINIEIIIVDDGSTDRTADVVRSFQDPRIKYIYQENQGQGAARNNGIRISKGGYVTFLDSDDFYLPGKIKMQVEFLEQNPEYHIVYCNALHFFSGNPDSLFSKKYQYPSGDIFRELLHSSFINPNTVMVRMEVMKNGFLFRDDRHRYWTEEWDLFLRISRAGYSFGYLNADLVIVEIREDSNTTWDVQWIMKRNALEMLESLFSQMDEEQKRLFQADKILNRQKAKLVVACLVSNDKNALDEALLDLVPWPFVWLIRAVAKIMPFGVLRSFLIRSWKMKQKQSFCLVQSHYNIEALLSQVGDNL